MHQYVCKGSGFPNIVEDDGDPAWENVETYRPTSGTEAVLDSGKALWTDRDREGPEIFIDIPNTSRYRNEVFRIRTKTMSPAFLQSYRAIWQIRSRQLRDVLQGGESIILFTSDTLKRYFGQICCPGQTLSTTGLAITAAKSVLYQDWAASAGTPKRELNRCNNNGVDGVS